MSRAKLHSSTLLLALLLAVLISFSAVMCLADAFSLSFPRLRLLMVCGGAALISVVLMLPKKGRLLTLAAMILYLALAFWMWQPLKESALALLYHVTTEYASCYSGVTVLGQSGNCLLILSFLSVPFSWLTAWIICREGNSLFLLLAAAPIFLLCLIIVDIAPILWLLVLTFCLLLLLMTRSVRERDVNEGSRLAWWLLLPSVILITGITVLWPPADYTRSDWSEQLRETTETEFRMDDLVQLPEMMSSSVINWDRNLRTVDLSRIGPKSMTGRPVLQCRSAKERLYLRGVSLGVYEDNSWQAVSNQAYEAENFPIEPLLSAKGSGNSSVLEIETRQTEDVIYTTYMLQEVPETAVIVDDTYVKNEKNLQEYTIIYDPSSRGYGAISHEYEDYVNSTYTQVPEDLRAELEQFLRQTGWDSAANPEELARLVQSSAVYDLNTPRIPDNSEFVLYFLKESHRGYCIHFATATVMLLRTMDIPARYVTGYSVSGEAGTWTEVTEDDAHAWVEYYVNGLGWQLLDPTPAVDNTDLSSDIPETSPQPQEPPKPETEPPTANKTPVQSDKERPDAAVTPDGAKAGRWLWLLLVPFTVIAAMLRRWIVIRQRIKRCRKGHPNRRAMVLWRWLILLAKQDGVPVEEEWICMAEKARFSQHTLSEEELGQLQQAVEQRIQRLQETPGRKQLWFRYGLILY